MSSPARLAWRKFRRNLPAMLGMGYVGLCLIVALLGYALAPDNSPNANFQALELAKQPPGSTAKLLMVPQAGQEAHGFSFIHLLTGKPQPFIPIPLAPSNDLTISENQLHYTALSGATNSMSLTAFPKNNTIESIQQAYVKEVSFLLGTDSYGRDLLSRIMIGTRVSLAVGFLAVLISLVIGISLGIVAGYYGGWIDKIVMWLVSVMWSIPTLLLALAISFVLGKGFWQLFVAIGLSMWVELARIVRGQVLSVRALPMAEAGRALGYPSGRIMFRHILPNITSPIIVVAVANFGAAVLIESGLSFLGIGVEVPIPSWGRMIYEGYTFIMFENGQWLAIFPGAALIFLVISINLIGIGLRDAFDVKL